MKEIFALIDKEKQRQQDNIELIASENIVSQNVLKAVGSILTNKYAEGYCGHRYYNGCDVVDKIEQLAIDNCCKLFNCKYVNVQPHSGASANLAVLFALCETGDTILGMSLDAGGHLTHGAKPTISGKWFNSIQYGLTNDGYLNYDELKTLLHKYNPKLLIVGASAYSRIIEFEKINTIVSTYKKETKHEIYVMTDIAHIAGLVATGLHPDPFICADVVTSTTHKTLRGPRGAIIMTNKENIAEKIDKSVFPGCQGGPLEHVIAGKAVCFHEALQNEYKIYMQQVVKNANILANELLELGFNIVSGGTDNHLMLVDLTPFDMTGSKLSNGLEKVNITLNKNAIPNDPQPKTKTSGVRIGTPAITTRGFVEKDMKIIAKTIKDMVIYLKDKKLADIGENDTFIKDIKNEVKQLTDKYPLIL
ncbi:MAG: serine hydroxymethyltransferase [Rickettsiales bacterium]|jgi:glycine hydroxymethyltransferase|nr:serine hydroxymethyltransferase [Rickettsiales bacterium]